MIVTVGIDYTAAVHQSAGIGRYTREIVKGLATLRALPSFSPCYRLFVADVGKDFALPPPAVNFTWRTTRFTERWLARLWYRLRLPISIENWTGPVDLFHAPDFILPPLRRGTRSIVTIHDLSFVREPDSVMPGMSRHLNKWVPWSVQQASHVIAVSEATRQDLIELYQTPPEKISVLYHGVGPEFKPIREMACLNAVRQKYGLNDGPFILSVGTIQPRKNYQRLIQAFAKVDSKAMLVIAGGTGWKNEAIFDEVNKLGLQERVRFPGFVAEVNLPALYSAATLVIYPSLYEGFGLPVLEALACGAPVIASNRSSLPEVVGEAGLLIDPYDIEGMAMAMRQLLEDSSLRARLSGAGQARAASFTWSKTATELVNLYKKVITEETGE
jgi:glycosyltransferase involved in cell wall biosynthesis